MMERPVALICLALICVASATEVLNPRGPRPMEPGTGSEKCDSKKQWPFCTDDDWGPKCPSGCRIQGLMNKNDLQLLKKIEKVRSLLDQNEARHRSAEQVTKQTYDYLKEKLSLDTGENSNYYILAQNLRRSITDMKIKIDSQLRILAALKDRVKDQVSEMQKLEVDIDIKLRSCKGSCERYSAHQVEVGGYAALEKQLDQLEAQSAQSVDRVGVLYVMKSRPLRDEPSDSLFKSKDSVGQQKDMFQEIKMARLILDLEGSSASPATISKVPVCVRLMQQNPDGHQPASDTHFYRKQHCQTSRVTMCSDVNWGSKCPSSCRLQGLISQMEGKSDKKLREVCKKAKKHENAAQKSLKSVEHAYIYNLQVIINRHVSDLKVLEHVQGVSKNLTSLQTTSSSLLQKIAELQRHTQKQLDDLYRTEVDIDIRLRACSGSCQSVVPFSMDQFSYRRLQTDMDQLEETLSKRRSTVTPPEETSQIKLLSADVNPALPKKTVMMVQRELLNPSDNARHKLVVEEAADVGD